MKLPLFIQRIGRLCEVLRVVRLGPIYAKKTNRGKMR